MQQQTVEGKERSKEVLEGEPYEVSRNYNEKEGVLDLVREIKLAVGENPDIKIQAVAGNIKIVGATDIDTATLRAIYRVYGKTEEEAEKTIGNGPEHAVGVKVSHYGERLTVESHVDSKKGSNSKIVNSNSGNTFIKVKNSFNNQTYINGVLQENESSLHPNTDQKETSQVSLELLVPEASVAKVVTGAGDIEAAGLMKGGKFGTAAGNVRIEKSNGDIEVKVTSGDIKLVQVEGGINLETVKGGVSVDGKIDKNSKISTLSGDVKVKIEAADMAITAETPVGSVKNKLTADKPSRSVTGRALRTEVGNGSTSLDIFVKAAGDITIGESEGGAKVKIGFIESQTSRPINEEKVETSELVAASSQVEKPLEKSSKENKVDRKEKKPKINLSPEAKRIIEVVKKLYGDANGTDYDKLGELFSELSHDQQDRLIKENVRRIQEYIGRKQPLEKLFFPFSSGR